MMNYIDYWRSLWDQLEIGVMVIARRDGRMLFVNRRVWDDLRRQPSPLRDIRYTDLFLPEFASIYKGLAQQCADGREHKMIYYWAERHLWEQVSAHEIIWADEQPAVMLSITNVSEIARSEYKYESLLYFDNLLNLPNGQKLEEDITALASVETVALLYFEVERFEDINELYGWDVGDSLLRAIRDWLLESERRRAQLYRASNGFVILGRNTTIDDAHDRAREILRRFDEPWVVPFISRDFSVYLSIKLGIVYGKYVKNEMRNLLLRTIRAAPTQDGYTVYNDEVDRDAKAQLQLQETLIHCVLHGMVGFEVHYQPLVDARTQRWCGIEALCRWTTPDGDRIPPFVFIDIAERLGLIDHIDAWVQKTAVRQCAQAGLITHDFFLDVNFSPTKNIDEAFVSSMLDVLHKADFPPHKFTLEITESTRMRFDELNLAGLHRLLAHGIRLSLDDFGTGYSSLENLINIAAHALKVDKVFVDDIETDPFKQYLLRVLVDIAHHVGMSLVAEGVETQGQYELLRSMGVDLIQGYLFSRPVDMPSIVAQRDRFLQGN